MRVTPEYLTVKAPRLCAWANASPAELIGAAERAGIPTLLILLEDKGPAHARRYLLDAIQKAVCAIFPAWLPGAEEIGGSGGGGQEAAIVLAKAEARRSDLFEPYLTAITKAALSGNREALITEYAPETIIRECHKLFRRAYKAERAALIIHVPDGFGESEAAEAQDAALFIANQHAFHVWIVGVGLERFDRIPRVGLDTPRLLPSAVLTPQTLTPRITPLAGRPNPFSEAEKRLEAFLCRCKWAAGRVWNARWSDGILTNPIWVDLLWETERLVVELDGIDHLQWEKFSRDRARDRALQRAGFCVLRFTNEEVNADVARVASEIQQFLAQARR